MLLLCITTGRESQCSHVEQRMHAMCLKTSSLCFEYARSVPFDVGALSLRLCFMAGPPAAAARERVKEATCRSKTHAFDQGTSIWHAQKIGAIRITVI